MTSTPARIARLLRPANGSSQPWFCELDDGAMWLVKFAGAGPGVDALLAEYVAGSIGRCWGLPIPELALVVLDDRVERAGTDEFWDVLAASRGWNLAVRVIDNAENVVPDPDTLGDAAGRIVAFDRITANWDRTRLSRNVLRDDVGRVWWIDHGSCRFLHHLDAAPPRRLPGNHALCSVEDTLPGASLGVVHRSVIDELVATIPGAWRHGLPGRGCDLAAQLDAYLRRVPGA